MSCKTCYPLHGMVPIINTPFDERLEIDVPSLERLVQQGVRDGIVRCIVSAAASEVDKLTSSERQKLVEMVAAITGKRIEVIAGVSSEQIEVSMALARHAIDVGCAGILCRVPTSLKGDDAAIIEFFHRLTSIGLDMLMIQNLTGTAMA